MKGPSGDNAPVGSIVPAQNWRWIQRVGLAPPACPRRGLKREGVESARPLFFHSIGAPGEIRTPDHLVRSQVLYPTELRALRGRHSVSNARLATVMSPHPPETRTKG